MRVLVAVNAHSRRGGEPTEPALQRFRQAGFEVHVETASKSKGIPEIIERHAASAEILVLGGGDGTLHAAAPALLAQGRPVGILPLGTANDLARTLAIPTDLAGAAEIIVAGKTRRIDLGEVNGRPFFNVASIGLAAALKAELKRSVKQRWGRLGYALAGLRALKALRLFAAEITAGDATHRVRTVQIAVGNGRYYGGYATVDAQAHIDDGRLHLYSIETQSLLRLMAMYPAFLRGEHGAWDGVRRLRGTEFVIQTDQPMPIVADGKNAGSTPAHLNVRPGALEVFAP